MSEGQPKGEYWAQDALSKDELLNNDEFLRDASLYLLKRTKNYYDPIDDKEKVYNEFIEQFRGSSVNEVSAIKDYAYLQREDTTDEEKERMGKLFLTFDRIGDADTGAIEYIKDYGGAILSAPSTWLGLGAGKVAGAAAGKGVSLLAKKAATRGLAGKLQSKAGQIGSAAAGTAVFEGGIEAGAEYRRQQSQVEARTRRTEGSTLDEKDEVDVGQVALSAGLAGVSAGALSGVFRAKGILDQGKTSKILKEAEDASAARTKAANELADKTAKENAGLSSDVNKSAKIFEQAAKAEAKSKERYGKFAKGKNPLEAERVARGKELGEDILEETTGVDDTARVATKEEGATEFVDEAVVTRELGDDLEIKIKTDTVKRISALAVRLAAINGVKTIGKTRITDILAEQLVKRGKSLGDEIPEGANSAAVRKQVDDEVKQLMDDYDLTYSDIADLFAAEFSEAGKTLQIASQNKQSLYMFFEEMRGAANKGELDKVVDDDIISFKAIYQDIKNMDQVARGLMTAQPATTVRNTVGAGLRVATYALNNTIAGAGEFAIGKALGKQELAQAGLLNLGSAKNIFKYLAISSAESKAVRELAKGASEDGRMAFRAMADITSSLPGNKVQRVVKKTEIVDGKAVEVESLESATKFTDGLVKGTRYLNALNTASDNLFKTAVHAAELAKQVGGEKNLLQLAKEGKFNTIEASKLKAAADEALFTAYQKGYKQDTLGSKFITAFSQPYTTPFIPFPRFVVNSLEFTYQHAPLIGAIQKKEGGGLFFQGKVFGESDRDLSKRLAQQLTGFGMLAGGFQLRAAMGEDTTWYEIKNSAGEIFDNRALYGPYGIFMLMSDIAFRATKEADRVASLEGKQANMDLDFSDRKYWQEAISEISARDTAREILKATFGTTFKTGVNTALLQKSAEEFIETGEYRSLGTLAADVIGNWMNRFTVPVGVAKDVLGTFDPAYLKMEDTRQVNFIAQLAARARRSIPRALRTEEGAFSFTEDSAKVSPTRTTTPTRGEVPLIKQFTGATPVAQKNALERELTKVYGGTGYLYKLFPKKSGQPKLRRAFDMLYGDISEQVLAPAIQSKFYRNLRTSAEKKVFLKNRIDKELKGRDVSDFFASWAMNNIEDTQERKELINLSFERAYNSYGSKELKAITRRQYMALKSKGDPDWEDVSFQEKLDRVKQQKARQP